jgi:MFS family permease
MAPIFRGKIGLAVTQLLAAIPTAGIGLCTDGPGLTAAWCITGLGFGALRAASFTLLGEAVDGEEMPLNVGVLVSLGVIGQQFGAVLSAIPLMQGSPANLASVIIVLAGLLTLKTSAGHPA